MPRITPNDELHLIESIVAAHPGGIGIAEIEAAMAKRQGGALNRPARPSPVAGPAPAWSPPTALRAAPHAEGSGERSAGPDPHQAYRPVARASVRASSTGKPEPRQPAPSPGTVHPVALADGQPTSHQTVTPGRPVVLTHPGKPFQGVVRGYVLSSIPETRRYAPKARAVAAAHPVAEFLPYPLQARPPGHQRLPERGCAHP